MADLSELEHRITRALDRIGAGIAALEPPPPAVPEPEPEPEVDATPAVDAAQAEAQAGQIAELNELLDAERTASAQLEERLKVLKDRQEREVEALRAEVVTLRERVDSTQARNKTLRGRLEGMREALEALRGAAGEGTVTGEAVNTALQAELDGVAALRESDRAELDTLLGALEPLVREAEDA